MNGLSYPLHSDERFAGFMSVVWLRFLMTCAKVDSVGSLIRYISENFPDYHMFKSEKESNILYKKARGQPISKYGFIDEFEKMFPESKKQLQHPIRSVLNIYAIDYLYEERNDYDDIIYRLPNEVGDHLRQILSQIKMSSLALKGLNKYDPLDSLTALICLYIALYPKQAIRNELYKIETEMYEHYLKLMKYKYLSKFATLLFKSISELLQYLMERYFFIRQPRFISKKNQKMEVPYSPVFFKLPFKQTLQIQ